jgi:hypothetical protein
VTGDVALSHRAEVVVGWVKEVVKVVVGCGVFFFFAFFGTLQPHERNTHVN